MDRDHIREEIDANQRRAADPKASVWVSASAGTGKTSVLIKRLERLLLMGVPPEKILCLTYTNAAAAEMQNRLHEDLRDWSIMDDPPLLERLRSLIGAAPGKDLIARARQLFTLTLETKGGLKIHTIHGFCERLLHRFPLEAGIAPDFVVLDEIMAQEALRLATDRVLSKVSNAPDSELGQALERLVAMVAESTFRDLLGRMLSHSGGAQGGAAEERLADRFGVAAGKTSQDLEAELAGVLDDASLKRAINSLEAGGANDAARAQRLRQALESQSEAARATTLRAVFLTQKGDPVQRLATKACEAADRGLTDMLERARDAFHELWQQLQTLGLIEANAALGVMVAAIRDAFAAEKSARAALDYDDLIERTAALLNRSEAAQWVLYKLDGGIKHILVDEAQDTSPLQWQVISALAGEFFVGEGARDPGATVFAVGDEKQSIYGFQGAAPEQFAAAGKSFERAVAGVGGGWQRIPLNLSFRSSPAVLQAVDGVFARPPASQGVVWGGDAILHHAFRDGAHGLVEIWPTVSSERRAPADAFDPLGDDLAQSDAPAKLAMRIAKQIQVWCADKTWLASRGRPIEPGDIMILVRKRHPFAQPMIRALKECGIPVAGADRMRLNGQLAVMDLLAFGRVMLTPQDDLSLACVLKGPLIGLDDDDLYEIGWGREGSLWQALHARSRASEKYAAAAQMLKEWQARADFLAPYEFYAQLLEQEFGANRRAIIARIGPDAGDALDEFLNAALAFDASEPPALQGFLHWMERADVEIKRDLERARNEVRVMTVHGAKGLEADIVFLPDTCSNPQASGGPNLLDMGDERLWVPPGAAAIQLVGDAREAAQGREREEYHRLLYVAMTRARDRLYVCGFEGLNGRRPGCWYDLIFDALSEDMVRHGDGAEAVWRLEAGKRGEEAEHIGGDSPEPWRERPDWAVRQVNAQPPNVLAVTPSSVSREIEGEDPRFLADQAPLSPIAQAGQTGFARGRLVHKLLQYLPDIAVEQRQAAGARYADLNGGSLDPAEREQCVTETLTLLGDELFAPLFASGSQAEVPLVARLGGGENDPVVEISGQIDRLVIGDNEILIADYKTNRPPPAHAEQAAPAYLAQLAAYRAALKGAFPNRPIRCALVWTVAPRLMAIPDALLDAQAERLFTGRAAGLDAP